MPLPDLKICLIDSLGSHYRLGVYKEIEKNVNAAFYFGNRESTVRVIDYLLLKNFKGTLHIYKLPYNFFIMPTAIKLALNFDCLILAGDPYGLHNWIVPLLRKVLCKKTILWTHGWYGRETWVRIILKKIFLLSADVIWLYGEYARSLMIQNGFDVKKLVVINNSLDLENQERAIKANRQQGIFEKHFGNRNRNIIFIGRLTKEKRLDLIIRAAGHLEAHYNILVNVTLVGDIIDALEIEKALAETNIRARVWMFGPSYEESVNCTLLSEADVCVSPGNVGLTAINALTYGCPVITHDDFKNQMPEFEAIEPGVTGAFFKRDDLHDLAKQIYHWVSLDEESKKQTRLACYATVKAKWNPRTQGQIMKKSIIDLFAKR